VAHSIAGEITVLVVAQVGVRVRQGTLGDKIVDIPASV
jgi:hypothetical protein